jgi:hypothetical protein
MNSQINHGLRSLKSRVSIGLALMLLLVASIIAPVDAKRTKHSDSCDAPNTIVYFDGSGPEMAGCQCAAPGETHGPGVACQ